MSGLKVTPIELEKFYVHVDDLCEDIFTFDGEDNKEVESVTLSVDT